jgi:hypothetical protein
LKNTDILQKLYALTKEGIAGKPDQHYRFFVKAPSSVLSYAVNTLEFYVMILRRLRKIADEATPQFSSNGFLQFFSHLEEELTDCYFSEISEHLQSLSFRDGILVSASLGEGNKGMNYTLRKQKKSNKNWLQKLFSKKKQTILFTWPNAMTAVHVP